MSSQGKAIPSMIDKLQHASSLMTVDSRSLKGAVFERPSINDNDSSDS